MYIHTRTRTNIYTPTHIQWVLLVRESHFTRTHTRTHTHTHTHTHAYMYIYTHTHCLSLSLPLFVGRSLTSTHTHAPAHTRAHAYTHSLFLRLWCIYIHGIYMGWLRLVGSLKLWVSFAKETYKRDDILQKRPVILRSLLIVATPYLHTHANFQLCITSSSSPHRHRPAPLCRFVYMCDACICDACMCDSYVCDVCMCDSCMTCNSCT